jgi:eukaryotic-like serine/threonine-protein kinase
MPAFYYEHRSSNMHEIDETLSPGAVIRDRFLVVELLGAGGLSAVYLVQDQQREDSFFALKEVIATQKKARERFTFECSVLERLVHPALPRVHHVFDNEEHNRLYMLMDYIEGPNLETLRRIQPQKRFSLPVIIAILAPIVDAIEYLHQQDPPIIHRDIKPSNIIVPIAEGKTVLVDFGIAKEYDTQGTTSAVRYGSPGYGAPEHYTTGTNTRTDIYGLGATLYTLLTGDIPPSALDRMTQLSNENPDPLKPVSELVPSVPLHISRAIQRALSIKMVQRFATVQEFWQALQEESGQQPHISEALNSIVVSPSTSEDPAKTGETSSQPLQEKQLPDRRSRKRFLLPVLLALLLVVGVGAGFWVFTALGRNHEATPTTGRLPLPTFSPITHPTVAATATLVPHPYPQLAASYDGTIDDLQANVPSQMTLTKMQQNDGHISGFFSALHLRGTYSGFLDSSKRISFTVVTSSGRALYFTGSIRAHGNLGGSFCEIDQDLNCIPDGVFGVWNVAPGTTPSVRGSAAIINSQIRILCQGLGERRCLSVM